MIITIKGVWETIKNNPKEILYLFVLPFIVTFAIVVTMIAVVNLLTESLTVEVIAFNIFWWLFCFLGLWIFRRI